jgi:hypothetical protein
MFNNKEGEKLPEEARTLVRDKLLPFYVRASVIAKENQKLYRHVGFIVYSFSALAIVSVAIGALIYRLSPYAFFIEFLFLATILFLVIVANRRRTHKKWIENRFLAERIRSAVFFAVCGVEASLIEVPPYLRVAHRPDDWMVKVFYEIWNSLPGMKGCQKEYCQQCKEFIQKHWIPDQIEFHRAKAHKSKRFSKFLEWGGMVIFFIALIVAIAHCVFLSGHELHSGLSNLLIVFAIVLPAVGAAIGGIRSHWEYSRLEKRSRNMKTALADINDHFSYVNSPEALESLLRGAEELMLRETQDWLMLMRFAELKPVA